MPAMKVDGEQGEGTKIDLQSREGSPTPLGVGEGAVDGRGGGKGGGALRVIGEKLRAHHRKTPTTQMGKRGEGRGHIPQEQDQRWGQHTGGETSSKTRETISKKK